MAVLLALALAGGGGPVWEGAGAGAVALLGGAIALRRLRADADRPPIAPPVQPTEPPNHAPPFGAMLESIAEPILLVAGQHGGEPGARRFIFANQAARDLLGVQRDEGPLTTAVRAPEVLAAVDKALAGDLGEAPYEPGGAQDRVWRARATPVAQAEVGRPALALLTLRDETEVRRSERT